MNRKVELLNHLTVDRLEFEKTWSACGARHATLQAVAHRVMEEAATYFQRGSDDTANVLRRLGREFEKMQREASDELQKCIEADRLDREKQKVAAKTHRTVVVPKDSGSSRPGETT